jgi:hypothetical protein
VLELVYCLVCILIRCGCRVITHFYCLTLRSVGKFRLELGLYLTDMNENWVPFTAFSIDPFSGFVDETCARARPIHYNKSIINKICVHVGLSVICVHVGLSVIS